MKQLEKYGFSFLIYMAVGIIAVIFMVWTCCIHEPEGTLPSVSQLSMVQMTGTYRFAENGAQTAFSALSDIRADNREQVIITGNFSQEIPEGQYLMMYCQKVHIQLLINGHEVFRDTDRVVPGWDFLRSSGITPEDKVTLVIQQYDSGTYGQAYRQLLSRFSFGTGYGLLQRELVEHIPKILGTLVIAIYGTSLIVMSAAFSVLHLPRNSQYLSCGLLMVCTALCVFIDYDYITLLIPGWDSVIASADFILQMFIVEILLVYLKSFLTDFKALRISAGAIWIWSMMMILYFCLRFTGMADETDLLPSMEVIALTLLILETFFLLVQSRRAGDGRQRIQYASVLGMSAAVIAEILLFSMEGAFWIEGFYALLLLFSALQFGILVRGTRERMQQEKRLHEMEEEVEKSRGEIMMSQIQPHFLYNALATIRALCTKDPQLARTAIDHFSSYLRANLDSLKEPGCIPFARELDHVRNYLYIEQLRFGEFLKVEYDLETEDFVCPPLMLQTLVENAVKHGLSGLEQGGIVRMTTREHIDCYEVKVSDNGAGFDIRQVLADGKSHTGISNTRQRVETMCRGTLQISSMVGKGTTMTIRIPKGR